MAHTHTDRGEKNSQHKLTRDDVVEMRLLRLQGVYFNQISVMFGVSTVTAQRAIEGTTWYWVDEIPPVKREWSLEQVEWSLSKPPEDKRWEFQGDGQGCFL